ncbi:2,3-bisphosphoglycerate-dependent phosphoglycerate mutase [Aquibaculum sediminis]|uniref:2,3-bisphosphoglycerate-dependent phosphoglycerate mutase n=1 Tax=Aquibaculum sediminis TaxID=3231907 RepID=UPI0034511F9E
MSLLVLLRHGQSQWNAENRFTGFVDVGLTELGREEARKGGRALAGTRFDRAFSSTLKRAIETTEIALAESGSNEHLRRDGGWDITCHDDLRERDYGDLAGLNKAETAEKYGKEQVHIWRRSYDIAPPGGESLKDVVERSGRYYEAEIAPCLARSEAVLVGAHGNTVRALLVALGCHSPEEIPTVEIPTGVPMVFEVTDGKPGRYRFLEG